MISLVGCGACLLNPHSTWGQCATGAESEGEKQEETGPSPQEREEASSGSIRNQLHIEPLLEEIIAGALVGAVAGAVSGAGSGAALAGAQGAGLAATASGLAAGAVHGAAAGAAAGAAVASIRPDMAAAGIGASGIGAAAGVGAVLGRGYVVLPQVPLQRPLDQLDLLVPCPTPVWPPSVQTLPPVVPPFGQGPGAWRGLPRGPDVAPAPTAPPAPSSQEAERIPDGTLPSGGLVENNATSLADAASQTTLPPARGGVKESVRKIQLRGSAEIEASTQEVMEKAAAKFGSLFDRFRSLQAMSEKLLDENAAEALRRGRRRKSKAQGDQDQEGAPGG